MRVDSATRLIAAAVPTVYAAFQSPEALAAWLPPTGMSGRVEHFDAARGYRLVLTYADPPAAGGKASADEDIADVRRISDDPPHRIVEQIDFPSDDAGYAGTMTMTWTFEARDDDTLVTVEATDVPPGISPGDHVEGLTSSLENLARSVE